MSGAAERCIFLRACLFTRLLAPVLAIGLGVFSSFAQIDSPAVVSEARSLTEKGELEAAIGLLYRYLEDPGLRTDQIVAARMELGGLYEELGDSRRALSEFRKAVGADPSSVQARIRLGVALRQEGNLDAAVREFERAAALCPTCPEVLENLAQSTLDRGSLDQAIVHWRQVVALQPDSGAAHGNLGYSLLRADQVQEALQEIQTAVQLSPELASAHFHLAEALARAGQPEQALPEYEIAARLGPQVIEFQVKYGVALMETEPPKAVAQLQKAVELDPNNYVAGHALGTALRKAGKPSKAQAQFRRARELALAEATLSEAKVHVNKGLQLLESGDVAAAIEALQRALTVQPDFAAAHHYLGVALGAIGKWHEARAAFTAALQVYPADPEIHYNFGVVLRHQADWHGAVREFDAVTQTRPRHPQAWCALAGALVKTGESDRAEAARRRAQQLGPCELAEIPR